MGKLTVKEILNHPELAQYIAPQNCNLFLLKKGDYEQVANMANTSVTEAFQSILENSVANGANSVFNMSSANSDVLVTTAYAKSINNVFKEYQSKINSDKLALYTGFVAMRVLQAFNRANTPNAVKDRREIFFENGDYVSVKGNDIKGDINKQGITMSDDVRDRLARVVLISASQFTNNQKKKFTSEISGTYFNSGTDGIQERIKFSETDLLNFARSYELMTSMSNDGLSLAIKEGLTQKNILLKHIEKGKINKNSAVEFMLNGVITEEDFVRRVHKKSNMTEVVKDPTVDPMVKLLLFDKQKISVDTFKEIADFSLAYKAYAFRNITIDAFQNLVKSKGLEPNEADFPSDWNMVATAYTHEKKDDIIKDISELLTHDIFNYTQSMTYLRYMANRGIISDEESKYIEGVMQDFKVKELENNKENELIEVKGEGTGGVQKHTSNLTIDPQVRINYSTTLGAVKKLKVKGETFLKDSPNNKGKRNSLDGYELFIIPSKKIAVLEKLYETTRDKQGNIVYRKNKNNELIPAVENATYIMPIEMAKEFVEKKNKRDLIRSPYVERAMHTADWALSVEREIKKLRPEVEFDKENSKKWGDLVRQNYKKNKEERSL